jgi:hypothetical protein
VIHGAAVWRAWLVTGEHSDEIARWQSSAVARGAGSAAKLAVCGDLVAADVVADSPGSLEVADVICCHRGPGRDQPLAWLATLLRSYPGCAVAAIGMADGGCLVASRAGRPVIFHSFIQNEQGFDALVCAMFVHGWLTAGWPLAALDPPRLEAAAGFRPPAKPISFGMYYEGPSPGPSAPSRRCISSASGAPMSE